MSKPAKIEISHRTIIFTIFSLIFIWVLFLIRDIILQFFVALLLMTLLNPFVTRLEKFKIPRAISIFLVYLVFLLLIVVSVVSVAPPLIDQTTSFVNGVPRYLNNFGISGVIGDRILGELVSELGRLPAQAARFTLSVVSNIVNVVAVLIFAFYLLLYRDKLDEQFGTFFGSGAKKEFRRIFTLLENKLGGWLRGQVSLMVLVGVTTYLGLTVLGIPFKLPLAIISGLLEIIPYLGPLAAAVPAVIIGLGLSPILGLAVAALYFLIQQLENYVFVPKVMEKSAGVNPIVTLLALAIGFRIAGIIGVIISVPVVITSQVLIREYLISGK